jgi:hypothetical protein
VAGSSEQARAQGMGRTTTEGDDMTQQQICERIATLHFAMLMMRLGVGMRQQTTQEKAA